MFPDLPMSCALCHGRRVNARAAFAVLVCLAILASQGLGLHWHGTTAATHDHGVSIADGHVHTTANLASGLTPAHFDSHIADGAFDVQPEASSPGKAPAVKLIAALLMIAFAGLVFRPARRAAWPPLRPPRLRLRARFLPPSHAPPLAA
jgi:hypothetical protein